jgi:threonine/homoserine/homoserine lactone efflux protein
MAKSMREGGWRRSTVQNTPSPDVGNYSDTDLSQGLGRGAVVSIDALFGFSLIAFGVALTPGPNMVYAMSRSLIQGRAAGMIALLGVLFGSLGYLVHAALGVGMLLHAVPQVYDVLRIVGAIYLGYLAWRAVHSAGWTNVDSRPLAREGHAKLFRSGVLVGLLNPATALLYLTVIPKFVDPARGSVLAQTLELGMEYIVINGSVKATAVVLAGARVIARNPAFARAQGWATGIALAVLALNLGLDARRPSSSAAAPSTQQIEITTAH